MYVHKYHSRKSGSSPRGSVKSDSFDPSETESSTSERTSVEGERRVEEEEEGARREEEEEERIVPPSKEQGAQFSSATIKPKVGERWPDEIHELSKCEICWRSGDFVFAK